MVSSFSAPGSEVASHVAYYERRLAPWAQMEGPDPCRNPPLALGEREGLGAALGEGPWAERAIEVHVLCWLGMEG